MKNSFFSFLILLAFSTFIASVNLVAQTKKVSTTISTTKGQPIVVSINGRRYQKVASNLQIGNLPKGRHYIEVFEFNKYADKNGGYAKLLYGGYVKMKAGKN